MKNRNIIKIDEVGRLVIPKEIRNVLGLNDKLVQISVESDRLIIKKYQPIALCKRIIEDLCREIAYLSGCDCIAGNFNSISVASSKNLKFLEGKQPSDEIKKSVIEDKVLVTNARMGVNGIQIAADCDFEYNSLCLVPIKDEICHIGFIALIGIDCERNFGEKEVYNLKIAKQLLISALAHERGKA